jgi:CubicO group peptidase (beta-lactamase class C family)
MTDAMHRRDFVSALIAPAFAGLLPKGGVIKSGRPFAARGVHPPGAAFLRRLPILMEVAAVPGIGVCVVRDGAVAWQDHRGVMDATTKHAVSADTLWPAASLGKPVFAFAALKLVDAGKLDLDRPLKTYLPDHTPDDARGNRITARHVLSHSSGLPNWREGDSQPLLPDFQPGSRFRYSGEGYYYLQRVVEHITGKGFQQFMADSVFAPLGMRSSTYGWRPNLEARVVTGHDPYGSYPIFWKSLGTRLQQYADRQNKQLDSFTSEDVQTAIQSMTPTPRKLPEFVIPNSASSLLTTPTEYGAFLIAMLTGGASQAGPKLNTWRTMLTPQVRVNSALAWGLGWGIEESVADAAVAHASRDAISSDYFWQWGDNGSWKNFALAHPASRSAIVVFTNGSRGLNVARELVTAATGLDHPAFWWL